MKKSFAALSLALSCYVHAPLDPIELEPIPASQPAATFPAASLAPPPGPPVAGKYLARLTDVQSECSGAGGLHAVLEILDASGATIAIAHHGGHAHYPEELSSRKDLRGTLFLVEYQPAAEPFKISSPGWCIWLPPFDGRATSLSYAPAEPSW